MATMAATRPLRRPGGEAEADPKGAKGGAQAEARSKGDGDGPPAKKSKKKLAIVALVVLVVAGAGYKMVLAKPKPAGAAATQVADGPIDSLDPLTVNLSDGHLLQVGVSLQLSTAAKAEKMTADAAEIQDAVISVFSGFTYPALLGPQSHDPARAQVLARVQALFPPAAPGGPPQVKGVYFTTFVMQ